MEPIKITTNISPYDPATFFIIVPVGLEELARHELYEKLDLYFPDLPIPEIEITKGGLQLEWEIIHSVMLNAILKIPTRILMRLDQFKCRDLPRLYKKIQNIPWKLFFATPDYNLSISAYQSRLFHSKRIEKSCRDGIAHYFKGNPVKKRVALLPQQPQTIYLRLENDLCTVSIDTSGLPLYKRGQKTFTSIAPIRENLAAALLYDLHRLSHQEDKELIDPMCGSGTFIFEAASFYLPTQRPFAFLSWPLFLSTQTQLSDQLQSLHPTYTPTFFTQQTGYDISKQTVQLAKKNHQNSSLKNIHFFQRDVLSGTPLPLQHCNNLIIINPPYGVRIPTYDQIEDFYHHIFQAVERDFAPELLGIIIPCGFSYRKIIISHYKLISKRQFSNGGLKVLFHIFERL
jgi:putative N6-adenine-specific DNA methylase